MKNINVNNNIDNIDYLINKQNLNKNCRVNVNKKELLKNKINVNVKRKNNKLFINNIKKISGFIYTPNDIRKEYCIEFPGTLLMVHFFKSIHNFCKKLDKDKKKYYYYYKFRNEKEWKLLNGIKTIKFNGKIDIKVLLKKKIKKYSFENNNNNFDRNKKSVENLNNLNSKYVNIKNISKNKENRKFNNNIKEYNIERINNTNKSLNKKYFDKEENIIINNKYCVEIKSKDYSKEMKNKYVNTNCNISNNNINNSNSNNKKNFSYDNITKQGKKGCKKTGKKGNKKKTKKTKKEIASQKMDNKIRKLENKLIKMKLQRKKMKSNN